MGGWRDSGWGKPFPRTYNPDCDFDEDQRDLDDLVKEQHMNTTTTTDTAPPVSEKEKLLPCPFCGHDEILNYRDPIEDLNPYHVCCRECGGGFKRFGFAPVFEWNQRIDASEGRSGWIPIHGKKENLPIREKVYWVTTIEGYVEKWRYNSEETDLWLRNALAWREIEPTPQPYTKEERDAE